MSKNDDEHDRPISMTQSAENQQHFECVTILWCQNEWMGRFFSKSSRIETDKTKNYILNKSFDEKIHLSDIFQDHPSTQIPY